MDWFNYQTANVLLRMCIRMYVNSTRILAIRTSHGNFGKCFNT